MLPENAHDPLLIEKAAYLNPWFFWIRAGFYFVFFWVCGGLLRRFSIAQDKDGSPRYTILNRRVTFSCALLFAVCLTFAAVDWLMGLDYHWFSTMWGVYIFAGTALSSMCVLVLITTALRSAGYLKGIVTMEHYHIMGKLMMAFTIFWAYIGFSQYMLDLACKHSRGNGLFPPPQYGHMVVWQPVYGGRALLRAVPVPAL